MNFLAVFVGGGLGSLLRYGIGLLFIKINFTQYPIATLISNILACLIMGLSICFFKEKIIQTEWFSLFVLTGFCGGFSTFSTFSYETFQLFENQNYLLAFLNVFLSISIGFGTLYFLFKNN